MIIKILINLRSVFDMLSPKNKIFFHKIRIYGFEKLSSYWDGLLFALGIPAISKDDSKNVVLFVGEHLPPRIPRMAKWLKRESDYTIILICHQRGFIKEFSDPSFSAIHLFRNAWHMKRILKQLKNVKLVHGFAPKSEFPNIARQFLNKPYIHDMQDVYTIYYDKNTSLNWLQKELPHEAECLTQADGIVAHSLEPNVALRQLHCKKKPKTIFFPLYCDDDFFHNNTKTLNENDIHLVYAGGVAGSHRNPAQYGNIQFHGLIKTLTEQKLHFHIYPSPSNIRADYEEYENLGEQNPYFHFHEPIAQQKLSKELSKYHFGLLPFFKSLSEQSDLKLKYATTLKLFNYLEAGIPVIVSEDIIFQNKILNRYEVAINVNIESIKTVSEKIEKSNYSSLLLNVSEGRKKLSLQNNIIRLKNFYASL